MTQDEFDRMPGEIVHLRMDSDPSRALCTGELWEGPAVARDPRPGEIRKLCRACQLAAECDDTPPVLPSPAPSLGADRGPTLSRM